MIVNMFSAIIIAFAFFTILPMPKLEWTGKRMNFVPMMMPLVGLANGLLAFLLYTLLFPAEVTPFLKSVLMTLYFIVFTGGLHLDGLLDTADAYFSRQDKKRKLEIMKGSCLGAFAAITLAFVLLLKTALLFELFSRGVSFGVFIIFIPVISRLLQAFMLYSFPSAKADGLTKIFGILKKKNTIFIYMMFAIVCVFLYFLSGASALIIPLIAVIYLMIFYYSSKRQFGGITGDLLGAFLEISELLMLFSLLFI